MDSRASCLEPRASHRVAVLGAGWAGLAAAVELAAAGVRVTIYEASRTLGGRARRVELNGLAVDNGAHILVGAYKETLRLIRLVHGDVTGLRTQPLDLHIHGHFRMRAPALPAPLHLAVALLAARGMRWRERLAAARFMQQLRRTRFRVEPDITVSDLLARHGQGENARRFLWEPLCVGALNTPPQEASAQVFLNVLRDSLNGTRSDSQILLPARDLSSLFPDAAGRFLEAHGGRVALGCAVQRMEGRPDGLDVITAAGAERFAAVICALPPFRVADVLGGTAELKPTLQQIAAMRFQPIYCAYLQYPAHVRLPQPMLGLAGGLGQWAFDRGQLCGQAGLIAVVISARGQHEDLGRSELLERLHAELRREFPDLPERPAWSKVIGEQRATFACTPGLPRPPQRTALAGLYLAGDYTESPYPGTLEAAVRSGVACARLALAAREGRRSATQAVSSSL